MNSSFAKEPEGDAFASIVAQTREEKAWYDIENLRKHMTARNCYMFCGCLSFFLLAIFGAVTIVVSDNCVVYEAEGRCCACKQDLNDTRMSGQSMPRWAGYNSAFYGIVMIVNSGFGIVYIISGIRSENKYQLAAMIATQVLEVARALLDALLETTPALQDRFVIREVLAFGSLALLIASTVLALKIWKQFGWAIFRRGGTLKPIRELYKVYQVFRGFNRMDVQSSALLFLIYGLYLQFTQTAGDWWVFLMVLLCDVLASRYLVKFLKQEDKWGFYISMVAKSYVTIWWIAIAVDYLVCRHRFMQSLDRSMQFFHMDPYPDLESISDTYNGVGCLSPVTKHDDRTMELIFLNLAQALIFRIASMVYGVRVARKFGTGLKGVFYKQVQVRESLARKREAEEARAPSGGTVVAFKGKRRAVRSSGLNSATELRSSAGDEDGDQRDADLRDSESVGDDAGDGNGGPRAEYRNYDNEEAANGGDQLDSWEREHGISRRELEEDLAW